MKDPQEVPVQLNINIPYRLRQRLLDEAHRLRTSQTAIVTRAIERELKASELTAPSQ